MPERVEVTVIKNGGKDYMVVSTRNEQLIAAILTDRANYIRDGHLHLIPGIDETLRYHGYTGELPEYQDRSQ